jgi:hypothetical protein
MMNLGDSPFWAIVAKFFFGMFDHTFPQSDLFQLQT